ncbi:MAG: alpha/beta hydrolase domain-containing protein [Nocardioides sp.]
MPPGDSGLMSARPEPDLAAAGYAETEYAVAGTAASYAAAVLPPDGRFALRPNETADFTTRIVLRRPTDPARFSGTLLVEWLNVSGGRDTAPEWTYTAPEILRRGHAWAGVSAQHAGVEGGTASVEIADAGSPGLKGSNPERYSGLQHPGDAFAFDIFTQVADALRAEVGSRVTIAVGESQSAVTLTTYVNGVQPLTGLFDGFLIHSRGAVAAPLGTPGAGLVMDDVLRGHAVRIREDTTVPVLMVQTEGDLFGRIGYLPARQPDTDRIRLWEVAGTAHADKYLIGDFEELLGCAEPVNRGQQCFVLRAALRHLDRWARGGHAPPTVSRLEVDGDRFVLDACGNVRGGVRTPVVDAPVEVLSGIAVPGSSTLCRLFGSTSDLAAERVAALYPSRSDYLTAYAAACDAAISAGLLLAEDRAAVLADARPHLVPG